MKYNHAVIVNGKFYLAGEEVPEIISKPEPKEETADDKKATRAKKK